MDEDFMTLKFLVEQIDTIPDEWSGFISVSGEIVIIEDRYLRMADRFEEDIYDLSKDEIADYNLAKDIIENNNYIRLPNKWQINEYRIMEEFSENYPDAHIRDCLSIAITGKGAFRRFKDTIIRFGIDKEWYKYRDDAFMEFAQSWCNKFKIAYTEEL
jgi:hypothetical protein